MKKIFLFILFTICLSSVSNATTTYQYNCDDNTTAPTIGANIAITTDNATVNSRDVQYSNTTAKKITVSSATIPINKCTVKMDLRLEFAASDSTLKPFFGKYNGALGTNGDGMLVSSNNSIQLFMPGNISTVTWESAAINNAHNDGLFHKWELHVNNDNPVTGNSHVALYLDDVLQPITANDRTTPWTAVTNTDNVKICAAGFYAVGTMYVDDILVTDTPPIPPTVTITSPSSDPADIIFIDNFTLAGTSSVSSGSVDSVSWVDNRGNSGSCTGTANWTAAITGVVVGDTTYTVTAISDSGGVSTDELTITYTTDDPPDPDSTFTWNCTDINSPLVGTISTKNTVDTVDDGRDTQYASQANAVCAKIPSSYISPNVGTIHIFAKFDAGTAENRVIAGSYNGQVIGYLQLYAPSATEGFKLVIYTASGFSTVSNFWSSAEVLNILGDGLYHDIVIQWDRSNLLTASSHMRLSLDGTLISPTTNDASSGWVLLPDPSVTYGIGGDPVTAYSLPSMGGYLDFVEILSTAGDIVTTTPIVNTTFTSNHIFPVGTNGTAVADIASTITGGSGASLEYQIYNSTDSSVELINGNEWNTVSNLSWTGDDFTCDLPEIPKSKSVYKCYLRAVADPDTVYSLDTVFKVGIKIAFIGQSNAVKLFRTNTGTPDPYTVRFPAGFSTTGAAGINLINDLVTLFDCWVEVHEFGVDGSGITEADGGIYGWWLTTDGQSPSTEYTTFINSVNSRSSSRTEFNFVYWYQGESSAGFGMSRIDYNTNELAFFAQLRGDISGPGGTVLPIMSVLLARWDDTDPTDAEWAAINQAKIDTETDSVSNYLTAVPDSTLFDLYHLDEVSGIRLTDRIAAKTGGIYGVSPVVENPGIDYYEIINDTTTDVYLINCVDFTPTIGIDSFTVVTSESGRISTTGAKQADSVVRLTHAAGTVTNVEAMYGTYPSIANILKSTDAYNLPITPTYFSTENVVIDDNPALLMMMFE